ncbi:hypothetical protein [Georgenia muralis]|uniref:Uncharacterized protein n=1 Tax=Georgenia muralis TaxID=154117 RepID=A0A3N4ZS96_9MICO|nr:hypothetical protein [Georgenia muralis]RPF28378.1 hypothetical protein EDD32_2904 [Georgenia muralis]
MAHHRARDVGRGAAAVVGVLLLLVLLPVFLSSGLLAPGWAVVALVLVWVVALVLAVRWFRRHPGRVLALPFALAAVWLVTMYVGDLVLGWTA